MKRNKVYLQHILDSTAAIDSFVAAIKPEEFLEERLLQDGVIRELEIIGEAAKNLSEDFRNSNNHIPWKDIMGTRDRLIHEYFGVDLDTVWKTAKQDLPRLKKWVDDLMM